MSTSLGKDQFDLSILSVRDKTINRIYFISMLLVTPALVASIFRISVTGFKWVYLIQIVLEFSLIFIYIFRGKLSLNLKIYYFLAATFITSYTGLYSFGYFGEAKTFLLLIPIFVALFLNKKLAYYSAVICAIAIGIIAYLYVNEIRTYNIDLIAYINSPLKWTALIFTYLTIMVLLIYIITTTLKAQNDETRRRVEKDLQLAGIAGAFPGVVFQFRVRQNGSYYFSYISDKAKEIFGLSHDVRSTNWTKFDMLHEDDMEKLLESINKSVKHKSDWSFEGRIISTTNSEGFKWFKGVSSPVEMADELVYNGVLLDITTEKAAEKAIENEKRFSDKLINNIPGIFYLFESLEGKYKLTRWNLYHADELGYQAEEIRGQEPPFFFASNSQSTFLDNFNKLLNGQEQEVEFESNLKMKSGEEVPFYLSGQLFKDMHKQYFFLLGTNVKELKNVQAELDEHRLHLKSLVRERTKDLQSSNEDLVKTNAELEHALDQLHEAQDRLVQSEKLASIGTFVAGIAHEINNPLNFIAGGQNILGHSLDDFQDHKGTEAYEDLETAHEMISDGMARVSNIVKALMTFSFSGQSVLQDANINKILDNSLLFLKSKLTDDIKVVKEYGLQNNVPVYEEKVHQIFLNILDNAIYATSQSVSDQVDKQLTIVSQVVNENDKEFAQIKISNTGSCIPEEKIKQIFDPFYTTKQPGEGTGLGLSITYSLVQEHEGTITANNIEGGVEFSINFPYSSN